MICSLNVDSYIIHNYLSMFIKYLPCKYHTRSFNSSDSLMLRHAQSMLRQILQLPRLLPKPILFCINSRCGWYSVNSTACQIELNKFGDEKMRRWRMFNEQWNFWKYLQCSEHYIYMHLHTRYQYNCIFGNIQSASSWICEIAFYTGTDYGKWYQVNVLIYLNASWDRHISARVFHHINAVHIVTECTRIARRHLRREV